MSRELQLLQEKFPFLALYQYSDEEMIGLVQNQGKSVVSVYVYNNIKEEALRRKFLELAQEWWWSSNRKIPINLFFKQDFDIFSPYVVNYVAKEFKILNGHTVSLQGLNNKRVKRKRVELVIKQK